LVVSVVVADVCGVLVGIICQHFGIGFVWVYRMDAEIFLEGGEGCAVLALVAQEKYAFFGVVGEVGAYKQHDAA
jgi:hypothetical protein